MTAAGLPEIAAWLAGFGGLARALEPLELVQAVAELHRAGLVRYAGTVRQADGAEAEAGAKKAGLG